MHKIYIIAKREYLAAVRTKAFLVGLLLMPVLMGGSILFQILLRDVRDTRDQKYVVVDRTPGNSQLTEAIDAAVKGYNETGILDPETKTQAKPKFVVETERLDVDSPEKVDDLRAALSERVRKGEIIGFAELGPDLLDPKADDANDRAALRYQTNRPTQPQFAELVRGAVATKRYLKADLKPEQRLLIQPVKTDIKGLSTRNPQTGKVEDASDTSRIAAILAPVFYIMLMFMVVMMTATPLMQSVLEEKMQRIAEVLLGSATPFQIMLGKLLGMTGVSVTVAAVYLTGGYWAAHRYGMAEYAPFALVGWFFLYQALAVLMFGALFIAVGAACTDLKETQSLLMPIMLLTCMPMFVLSTIMTEPNGPVATGLSFFPFATPMLMIARQAIPPGIPWWQPIVGITLVLLTTLVCVWAAGRIFRIGLLMQGKGASYRDLVNWVIKG